MVWEIWMEMDRFYGKAKEEDQGAVALVLDLAKAFERVSLLVVWAWATHFQGRPCECCAVIPSTRGVNSSKDVWRNRSRPFRPSCYGLRGVVCFCGLYCRIHMTSRHS